MDLPHYPPAATALLLIDPYNDFLAEGGMLWPYLAENARRVGLFDNLCRLAAAARAAGIRVVYVPHHRHDEGDYRDWRFLNPTHEKMARLAPFARGTWGGEFHPALAPQPGDLVAHEHWMHSGFAHTDLDYLLRMRGLERLVLAGVRTNACFEATARHGVELGYHVTLVEDATAAFARAEMDATFCNAPAYAHAIAATDAVLARFAAAQGAAAGIGGK